MGETEDMHPGQKQDRKDRSLSRNYKFFRLVHIISLTKTIIRTGAVIWIVYIIRDGFIQIAEKAPDQIGALARFMEAMHMADWLPWCVAAICGIGWRYERWGKKRAIKEKDRLQKELEMNDPRWDCALPDNDEIFED